jgi:predicted enzyme related to lactoylglutathione lyase
MARLLSLSAILPTSDLERTGEHYRRLGFEVRLHQGGYGTASRDGFNLHFRLPPDPAPDDGSGAVYFAVDDAEALHAEWVAAGVGETSDLFDPGFGVWEAAHTDPDGNIIRFGSARA